MRKDAVQALAAIKALGFTEETLDSREHVLLRHPERDLEVKLSLSPSDVHAPARSVRQAYKLLGLEPPRAASKRRPAQVRRAEQDTRRERERRERLERLERAHVDRWRQESRITADHRIRELDEQISGEMAVLRRCRTPAGRAAVEARIFPLARERSMSQLFGAPAARC